MTNNRKDSEMEINVYAPGPRVRRATDAEKATAWEMVMSSTGDEAEALMRAWEWLDNTVAVREAIDAQKDPARAPRHAERGSHENWLSAAIYRTIADPHGARDTRVDLHAVFGEHAPETVDAIVDALIDYGSVREDAGRLSMVPYLEEAS